MDFLFLRGDKVNVQSGSIRVDLHFLGQGVFTVRDQNQITGTVGCARTRTTKLDLIMGLDVCVHIHIRCNSDQIGGREDVRPLFEGKINVAVRHYVASVA